MKTPGGTTKNTFPRLIHWNGNSPAVMPGCSFYQSGFFPSKKVLIVLILP